MTCEEFEAIGLDAERDASLSEVERVAAREHADTCSRCAALQDSWQAAGLELRAFAEDTAMTQAPARVEMRLRQEFRTQHVTLKVRRAAVVAAWVLATAAVLAGAVSWRNWRHNSPENNSVAGANHQTPAEVPNGIQQRGSAGAGSSETLMADNELSGFTLLPDAFALDTDEAADLSLRMHLGALTTLVLCVTQERASDRTL